MHCFIPLSIFKKKNVDRKNINKIDIFKNRAQRQQAINALKSRINKAVVWDLTTKKLNMIIRTLELVCFVLYLILLGQVYLFFDMIYHVAWSAGYYSNNEQIVYTLIIAVQFECDWIFTCLIRHWFVNQGGLIFNEFSKN